MSKKQVAGYLLEKRIGKGSCAVVWKGRIEGSNPPQEVAVKVISRQTVTETTQLRQEVEVLRRITHPNIVRFRDLKKSSQHFYLVLEYCAGGDLSQFLRTNGRASEEVSRGFLTQIAAGLCVLHKENIMHRDLKPQNILLSDSSADPVLKIADFGFARALQPMDMAATVCGSPLYMAPEILRYEPYDARADLWSVGAILFEMLMGRPPFTGANPMQLLANIERSDKVTFDNVAVSNEGQEFLKALLKRLPNERLSSREFMRHPFVRLASDGDPPEGFVYSSVGGSTLVVPTDWCLPPSELRPGERSPSSGHASPDYGSPTGGSPAASPRGGGDEEGIFEMKFEVMPNVHEAVSQKVADASLATGSERESATSGIDGVPGKGMQAAGASSSTAASGGLVAPDAGAVAGIVAVEAAPAGDTGGRPRPGGGGAADEEYVVVTAQTPTPSTGWAWHML